MQVGQLDLNASLSNTDVRISLCCSACFNSVMCKVNINTKLRLSLTFDLWPVLQQSRFCGGEAPSGFITMVTCMTHLNSFSFVYFAHAPLDLCKSV